jgi:hypothetical protein
MNTTRPVSVLVATTVSRDPIALALELKRPHVSVAQVEPADLPAEVARRPPHLVIYSEPNKTVEELVDAWVLVCPGEAGFGVVNVAGEQRTVPDIGLADLLEAVDAVEAASHAPGAIRKNPPDGGRCGDSSPVL